MKRSTGQAAGVEALERRAYFAGTGELSGRVIEESIFRGETHGLAGVWVFLDANLNRKGDEGEMRTTTDHRGRYRFKEVPAGWHRVVADTRTRTATSDFARVRSGRRKVVDPLRVPSRSGGVILQPHAITVYGSRGADVIRLEWARGQYWIILNGISRTTPDRPKVFSVLILGRGGDDRIELELTTAVVQASGGAGDDTLHGSDDGELLLGDDGDDLIFGGGVRGFDDFLHGGPGDDTLYGEGGNDTVGGLEGDDWLFGGAGKDYLFDVDGSTGDHLDGGEDRDGATGDRDGPSCKRSGPILCSAWNRDRVIDTERVFLQHRVS